MKLTKIAVFAAAAAAAAALSAAPRQAGGRNKAQAAAQDDAEGPVFRVSVDQFPKTGKAATFDAPKIDAATNIGKCWTKPRKWIVLEAKYTTYCKSIWVDRLNFTWHVLLDTKTATEKSKDDRAKLAPYSYFNQTVTYVNIPQGSHAASVCLPPSYLERFGEPKAVGLVVTDANGQTLYAGCDSGVPGIRGNLNVKSEEELAKLFWNDNNIMGASTKDGDPMIERRQGLKERSETIWGLVNPNDYETVAK